MYPIIYILIWLLIVISQSVNNYKGQVLKGDLLIRNLKLIDTKSHCIFPNIASATPFPDKSNHYAICICLSVSGKVHVMIEVPPKNWTRS